MIVTNVNNHDALLIDLSIMKIDASNSDHLYRQVQVSRCAAVNSIVFQS